MTKIVIANGDETIKTWQDALKFSGEIMCKEGLVSDTFADACIKREKTYPTGLPAEEPVAIPHTDPEHVYKDALCFLRLKEPVEFRRIDNGNETVKCRLIINMAISKGENQVKMLRQLINMLKNKEDTLRCINGNGKEVENFILSKIG